MRPTKFKRSKVLKFKVKIVQTRFMGQMCKGYSIIDPNGMLHSDWRYFTKADAQRDCDELNKDLFYNIKSNKGAS